MKKTIKTLALATICLASLASCAKKVPATVEMSKGALLDKIKGGWAGQTIGCAYGGPTEFKWNGTMVQDYLPIRWGEGYVTKYMGGGGGLYDDIYMDLTFVQVFDKLGLDAPVDSFAVAFANAGYGLWHANQAARNNILAGIMPPESGHWKNNPHADDIDFQIEADFAGLMSPGMPNSAAEVADRIGHIMNSGDGWYGGVYVAAMYSLAFISSDIEWIVKTALQSIPAESRFYRCISDVIAWCKKYPDWKQTWFEVQKAYSEDIGCPDGVFRPYDIDAVINSAYVVMGLLYGNGDFERTVDVATRCGQDSDCNPSTAGGILGAVLGYSNIPEKWLSPLQEGEDIDFAFTTMSLNDTYASGFAQALQMIERGGGKVEGDKVTIACQNPVPVKLEKNFEGLNPVARPGINKDLSNFKEWKFEGNAFVIDGDVSCPDKSYVADVSVYVDGQLSKREHLPALDRTRYQEITWNYDLPQGEHTVTMVWNNPVEGARVNLGQAIVYSK